MIPKADGNQRELGIPTVVDRLIQQALLQVLQPQIDPSFSNHSHGFRPGRRAHDAVKAARAYMQSGKRVVVDVDLVKFFDSTLRWRDSTLAMISLVCKSSAAMIDKVPWRTYS